MPALDTGKQLSFTAGEIIIREGDFDTCAYHILSGYVEVFRNTGTREVVLARLGPDQFFGEMNLVLEASRAASVRAVEPCVVSLITQETFNRTLKSDPESALPMLRVLFERLRIMNAKYLHAISQPNNAPVALKPIDPPSLSSSTGTRVRQVLVLSADTDEARKAMGMASVEINSFPFRIGRKTTQAAKSDAFSLNDLYLPDGEPFSVSRNHLAIDMMPNGMYVVEDRGSTLGTLVNGDVIGIRTGRFEAFLTKPKNALVLGAEKSTFRFSLSLQPVR